MRLYLKAALDLGVIVLAVAVSVVLPLVRGTLHAVARRFPEVRAGP